jgi:hypothetical protein
MKGGSKIILNLRKGHMRNDLPFSLQRRRDDAIQETELHKEIIANFQARKLY